MQELNRNFLHPLGMALEILIDDNGSEKIGGVWDFRDDPEGIIFGSQIEKESFKEKADRVQEEFDKKMKYRKQKFGFGIQPCHKCI